MNNKISHLSRAITGLTVLLAILILLPFDSAAQNEPEPGFFSGDASHIVSQLEEALNISLRRDARSYTRKLDDHLKKSLLTPERTDTVVAILNLFHKQNLNYEYYEAYLDGLFALNENNIHDELFFNWHTAINSFTKGLSRRHLFHLNNLLKAGAGIFSNQRIHQGSTTNWYTRSQQFELIWQDEQPWFVYPETDLVARRRDDSTAIFGTRGILDPVAGIWQGEGGQIRWDRHELDEKVYCELDTFTLNLGRSTFRIANARLNYPSLFGNETVLGDVEERVVYESGQQAAAYPRFYSYENVLEIEDKIGPGIHYRGGFILRGTQVEGSGTGQQPAEVLFYTRQNELRLRATSRTFSIRQGERLGGTNVSVALYFDHDSITHPSVNFRYNIPSQTLQLERGDRGLGKNPFFDSYRKVLIDAENIEWVVGTDSLVVGKQHTIPLINRKNAYFESFDFYDPAVYHSFQSIASTNSLAKIKVYCETNNIRRMHSDDFAKIIDPRFQTETVVPLLVELMANGFIHYDPDTRMVEVFDKVFHYANAFTGKTDYDYLKFESDSDKTPMNAVIDLSRQSLEIQGLSSVVFSRPRQVGLRPLDGKVTMFENRNMEFEGLILAGYGELAGTDFRFSYDRFFVEFDSVNTFRINIPTGKFDHDGTPFISPLTTAIEDFGGVLMIDAPANKSGRREIQMFPLVRAATPSKVYYGTDDSTSAYPRSEFYFHVEPFVLENLNNLTAESVQFPGTLVSGGVFPDIDETLRIMEEDQSLGFTYQTPDEGLEIYGNQGTFTNELKLSGSGLQGDGNLALQYTSIDSRDFKFTPRETTATAETFELEEVRKAGVELPYVLGQNVSVMWRPRQDSLYVFAEPDNPFRMFDGSYTMDPEIVLHNHTLHGKGTFDWADGQLIAENMKFGAGRVMSDTARVNIKAGDEELFALSSDNASAMIDVDEQTATFRSNTADASTHLPYIQYMTSINEFHWDMAARAVNFKSDPGTKADFISVRPGQDSLSFSGTAAAYTLADNLLSVQGVDRILTGDAWVYPEGGLVYVEGDAKIQTLENAVIVASTVNENHTIENATVNIYGKNQYRAQGDYAYEVNGRMQNIFFSDIEGRVRRSTDFEYVSTQGSGVVKEADEFLIDPGINFRGNIHLDAYSKDLRFEGYARLRSTSLPRLHWFHIDADIDRNDVVIHFNRSQTEDQHPVYSGLRVDRERSTLYPLIMNMPFSRRDRVLLDIRGTLRYDPEEDAYHVTDSIFTATGGQKGNAMSLYDKLAFIDLSGEISVGQDLPYVELDNYAEGIFRLDTAMHSLDMFMALNFVVPDRVWDMMANEINSNMFSARDIHYRRLPHVKTALQRLISDERTLARVNDELEFTGRIIYPRRPAQRMVISHIQMEWDPSFQSLVNTGGEMGIAYLGDKPLNKYIRGYFEISEPRNGRDEMTLYIISPGGTTYYFNYAKNRVLRVHSSNSEINEIIENLRRNERFVKMPDGEHVEIIPAQARQVNFFVRRMEAPRDIRDAEMDRIQRELEVIEDMEQDGETIPDEFFLEARPADAPESETQGEPVTPQTPVQEQPRPGGWLNEGPADPPPASQEPPQQRGGWLNEGPAQGDVKPEEKPAEIEKKEGGGGG